MRINNLQSGSYVVAVSGGVDSMTLLHILNLMQYEIKNLKLVVAHFDHGIRIDSHEDRHLVQKTAMQYSLPFVFDEGNLGDKTSEATAREARYNFLKKVVKASDARAIITAHHQDDVIETAIINILRGTKRKGISSLKNRPGIIRPLLNYSKKEIVKYATKNKILWREDSTNSDITILRNYIRQNLLNKLSKSQKTEIVSHINNVGYLNKEIDTLLDSQLKHHLVNNSIERDWFTMLPHDVAKEVIAEWLRMNKIKFDKKLIENVSQKSKILNTGKKISVNKNFFIEIHDKNLALNTKER